MKKVITWACLLLLGVVFVTGNVGCKRDGGSGTGGTAGTTGTGS